MRVWVYSILSLLLLVFFLAMLGALEFLAPPAILLTGWVAAGSRYWRALHPDASSLVFFAGAVSVLIAGTHAVLAWLRRSRSGRVHGKEVSAPPWRWKWTISGFAIGFCVLAATTSAILTTHQVFWLSRSDEPWFVDRLRGLRTMHRTASELRALAERNDWDVNSVQAKFPELRSSRNDVLIWDFLQPIWVKSNSSKLKAVLLVPRTVSTERWPKLFAVVARGSNVTTISLEKLPSVLEAYGITAADETNRLRPELLP
jgi:hypothetical protein